MILPVDKHRMVATACLVFLIVFLYQMGGLIGKIESWEVIWNPPNVADMLKILASALGVFATALGLNVKTLAAGLLGKGE